MEAGFNSVWLLPNRIYEGGYFCTPAIAPKGTETARWIEDRACGFTIDEPVETSLIDLLRQLLDAPATIVDRAQKLAGLPETTFVQPAGFTREMIESLIEPKAEMRSAA